MVAASCNSSGWRSPPRRSPSLARPRDPCWTRPRWPRGEAVEAKLGLLVKNGYRARGTSAKGRVPGTRIIVGAAEYLRGGHPWEVKLETIGHTGTSKSQTSTIPGGQEELRLRSRVTNSQRVLDDQQPTRKLTTWQRGIAGGKAGGPVTGQKTELPLGALMPKVGRRRARPRSSYFLAQWQGHPSRASPEHGRGPRPPGAGIRPCLGGLHRGIQGGVRCARATGARATSSDLDALIDHLAAV